MHRTMDEYESNENEDKRSWIWSKAISVGKKVLTAGVVVSSAPLFVPPLIIASTIAFFSSVPFCLFLANYACTQKLMSSLLPANEETGAIENDNESRFGEYSKLGYGEGEYKVDETISDPILIQSEDDEDMAKESTSLIERIMDEGRTDRETSEKGLQDGENSENAKSGEVQHQTGKEEAHETRHEGELGTKGKDEDASSNEPIDQASEPHGTGEDKRKTTTKKKKKTGRAGV